MYFFCFRSRVTENSKHARDCACRGCSSVALSARLVLTSLSAFDDPRLGPRRKISTSVDCKVFFPPPVLFYCVRLPECLSVRTTALPVKDKCMRQWKQIWRGIKIDAERHGWLLALNTEALAVFHLPSVLSPSLFLSTSRPPAASGLSPQRRATIIGLSINTMGREFFLDHLITKRIHSTRRRGFPLRRLISFSFIVVWWVEGGDLVWLEDQIATLHLWHLWRWYCTNKHRNKIKGGEEETLLTAGYHIYCNKSFDLLVAGLNALF